MQPMGPCGWLKVSPELRYGILPTVAYGSIMKHECGIVRTRVLYELIPIHDLLYASFIIVSLFKVYLFIVFSQRALLEGAVYGGCS